MRRAAVAAWRKVPREFATTKERLRAELERARLRFEKLSEPIKLFEDGVPLSAWPDDLFDTPLVLFNKFADEIESAFACLDEDDDRAEEIAAVKSAKQA